MKLLFERDYDKQSLLSRDSTTEYYFVNTKLARISVNNDTPDQTWQYKIITNRREIREKNISNRYVAETLSMIKLKELVNELAYQIEKWLEGD